MNKEERIANKISILLNFFLVSIYAFVYYMLLMVEYNGYKNSAAIFIKSITLYILVSCLSPLFILYILNNNSYVNIRENAKKSNITYIVISISYIVSYQYFSMLNISAWFNIGLLIPFVSTIVVLIFKSKLKLFLDIIVMAAITSYSLILTIEYSYIFPIYPFLLSILLSGLLLYSYQITKKCTPKETLNNYIIGCFVTIFTIFWVLLL
jgi:hypothetical protein